MYNLVSCYDTLELKSRGDVLSDKVITLRFLNECESYHWFKGLHERHRGGGRGDAEDLPERVHPHWHDPRDQPHLRQVPAVLQVQRWVSLSWSHLDLTINHFFSTGSPLQPHQSNGGPNCNGNTSLSKPVSVSWATFHYQAGFMTVWASLSALLSVY